MQHGTEHYWLSEQERRRLKARALPLLDALFLYDEQTMSSVLPPLVCFDMRTRPDVADLARIQRSEGDFKQTFSWRMTNPTRPRLCVFYLCIEVVEPVRCEFALAFPMRERATLIDVLTTDGVLTILNGPPIVWKGQIEGKPGDDLMKQMAFWAQTMGVFLDFRASSTQDTLVELWSQWKTYADAARFSPPI